MTYIFFLNLSLTDNYAGMLLLNDG